jgi:hypothetical protein
LEKEFYMLKKMLIFIFAVIFILPISTVALERDEQIQGFEKKIRGMLNKARSSLPIIDVEYHHGGKIEMQRLLSKMDQNAVALTWLGPNENLGSEESIRLGESYPDRFVPTTVHGDGK